MARRDGVREVAVADSENLALRLDQPIHQALTAEAALRGIPLKALLVWIAEEARRPPEGRVPIRVSLDADLRAELNELAAAHSTSVAALWRGACLRFLLEIE